MDVSPVLIAQERNNQDIVELLSELTVNGSSPRNHLGPTSPEDRSPHRRMHTPPNGAISPNNILIRPKVMNNIAPKMSKSKNINSLPEPSQDKMAPKRKRKSKSGNSRKSPPNHSSHVPVSSYPHVSYGQDIRPQIPVNSTDSNATTLSSHYAPLGVNTTSYNPKQMIESSYSSSLPDLTDMDILEGMFQAETCFNNLPEVWNEPAYTQQPHCMAPQITNIISNPLSTSCMLPSTTIGAAVDMNNVHVHHGHPPHPPQHQNSQRKDLRHSIDLDNSLSMPSLPTTTVHHYQPATNPTFVPNGYSGRDTYMYDPALNKELVQQLNHQKEMMNQPTGPIFPTPPSAHSGQFVSSPNNDLVQSPIDLNSGRNVFLTPSPDTPSESPGRWSTSPPHSSNSESSVC